MRAVLKMTMTATAVASAIAATPATALEQGDWIGRVGVTHVSPNDDSGPVLGTTLEVDSDTRPSFTIGYMLTNNVGVEVLGAVPFEHDVTAASNGATVATVKHLPPTVSVQYYFQPRSNVRPYVGAGINYTRFFDEEGKGPLAGADVDLDSSWGPAAQVGVDFDVSDRWFVNADLRYIKIDTTANVNGSPTVDVDIDPWVATLAVGTTF